MRDKKFIFGIILGIFLIGIISAQASYCCERTNDGAWCQNAPPEECDTSGGLRAVPTSCEATSYCKLGTCINTGEGTCMPNSPQRVCSDNNGIWDGRDKDEIPQCQLGCCLIGDQASFVTQTRCKRLSSLYGLEVDYRTDIQNEVQCILSASANVKGACVFEEDFQRNCKMLTQEECQNLGESVETEFYDGYLCSAESLQTICGPRGGTTCVEGKDEVYFLDTCGNVANVYDYSRINDNIDYWTYIQEPDCDDDDGNKDSPTCGNCDYFLGSTCKKADRGTNVNYGNNICKDLDCEYEGNTYSHGETWCANSEGVGDNLPGSRYFRMMCYNNEVSVEPCADYRQEVCIQSQVNGFSTAACRVNLWQDCYSQTNQLDCENSDKRDCQWVEGSSVLKDEDGNSLAVNDNGDSIQASCVPKYAPGFNFWESGGDAESMCGMASTQCIVTYQARGFSALGSIEGKGKVVADEACVDACRNSGGKKSDCEDECMPVCVDEDGDLKTDWQNQMKGLCSAIGDCGSKTNFVGADAFTNWDDSFVRQDQNEEEK